MIDGDPVDVGSACGSAVGACVPGSEICSGGALMCSGGVGPTGEVCNGRDDNCDGTADEGLSQICYTGSAATRGVGICSDGIQACSGGAYGVCAGQVLPTVETCDGRDEDCDGVVDDGVTTSCYSGPGGTEGVGICHGGSRSCSAGSFGACTGEVVPSSETCDGRDENCNGVVDEAAGGGALTQSCYSGASGTEGVGTCHAGTQTCRFGAYDVCGGQVTPTTDRCGDGLDTDCDGLGDTAEGCLTAGGETRVDTGDALGSHHSYDVRIASGGSPDGRDVYAVWVDKRNGSNAADIFFSRSTDGGATWSSLTDLTGGTSNRAVRPEIVVGRSGSQDVVHVVYQVVPSSLVRRDLGADLDQLGRLVLRAHPPRHHRRHRQLQARRRHQRRWRAGGGGLGAARHQHAGPPRGLARQHEHRQQLGRRARGQREHRPDADRRPPGGDGDLVRPLRVRLARVEAAGAQHLRRLRDLRGRHEPRDPFRARSAPRRRHGRRARQRQRAARLRRNARLRRLGRRLDADGRRGRHRLRAHRRQRRELERRERSSTIPAPCSPTRRRR